MYRDFVAAPERCTVNGRDWWVQVLHRWDGAVDAVYLFDDGGELVREFASIAECETWLISLAA